ncbi:unannotated protein [freshwater metagenome]|uniref:Unannotated protein n=1 Tax=freshwater metagenome TaxID=449393 RepID=A0A6J7QX16_9ZZZZ
MPPKEKAGRILWEYEGAATVPAEFLDDPIVRLTPRRRGILTA